MNARRTRLAETVAGLRGPLARLERSLQEDGEAIARADGMKTSHDLLATDAFLQRFQQVTDLALRKLFPRLLAVLEASDTRHPFATALDRLDGYEAIADVPWWIVLNELRNRLIHEYAMNPDDRHRELVSAFQAARRLHAELTRLLTQHDDAEGLQSHD